VIKMLLSRMLPLGLLRISKGCRTVFWPTLITHSFAILGRTLLADKPDIVISTPSRSLALLQSKALSLTSLETLVIDEADLILSYGHDEDVRQIFNGTYLPKVYQSYLMSATLTEDVAMLKGLVLRNPVSRVIISLSPRPHFFCH